MAIVNPLIEEYILKQVKPDSSLLQELYHETYFKMPNIAHMICGPVVGHLLKFLVNISNAKHILEIGMFTGYSALSMAYGLTENARIVTTEVNNESAAIAKKYLARSAFHDKIEIVMGPALETLNTINYALDFVFIDADKENYPNYYRESKKKLKKGGLIVIDNALWHGKVLEPMDVNSKAIAEVNRLIAEDSEVDNILLSIRDGINIIQKK